MKFVMVSLVLMGICFSANTYSMEQDNSPAVNNALKVTAQTLYDKGQEVLSEMDVMLMRANFGNEDGYNMFVATEKSKANDFFYKSKRCIQMVINDQNADENTRKTVLDLEGKIDAILRTNK